jgi:hypothetical protein
MARRPWRVRSISRLMLMPLAFAMVRNLACLFSGIRMVKVLITTPRVVPGGNGQLHERGR